MLWWIGSIAIIRAKTINTQICSHSQFWEFWDRISMLWLSNWRVQLISFSMRSKHCSCIPKCKNCARRVLSRSGWHTVMIHQSCAVSFQCSPSCSHLVDAHSRRRMSARCEDNETVNIKHIIICLQCIWLQSFVSHSISQSVSCPSAADGRICNLLCLQSACRQSVRQY